MSQIKSTNRIIQTLINNVYIKGFEFLNNENENISNIIKEKRIENLDQKYDYFYNQIVEYYNIENEEQIEVEINLSEGKKKI